MNSLRIGIAVAFLMFGVVAIAQKDTRQSIDAQAVERLVIHTDEVFRISLHAEKTSQISITTHSEGEYFDNILLQSELANGTLQLVTEYPERLAGGFDKLSAHKVFSLEIDLVIPENLEVEIRSNIASVIADGSFLSLFADLNQGYCKLQNFAGSAVVNTFRGNIEVETTGGIVEASSRHGQVEIPDFMTGRNPLKLTSIDGNIRVVKTK